MSNGLQTFLRMANLFNPQQMSGDMPSELPIGKPPQLINRGSPGISMPDAYGDEGPIPDETLTAQVGEPQSTLEAFRQSVLNPPQRTQMTYPKSTLNGLTAALQIAAEPSPLEKNRVWVNGKPHQKQSVRTDPVTGEKQFITNVREPSFGSQVMRAMPAAISGAVDTLNQPREDAVADWEMRNKGLAAASQAESQSALAEQRRAQASAIPEKLAQGSRALDIRQMDANTRARLAELKDLPDSEKMQLLQEGRISLEEIRAANRYTIQELRGEQAKSLEGQRQLGRVKLEGIKQGGRLTLEDVRSANDQELEELRQSGRLDLEGNRQVNREILVRQRGEQARETKRVVPGGAGQLPTQQRVTLQRKAADVINQNPTWGEHITFNEQGFPIIAPPATGWFGSGPDKPTYDAIYQALYGTDKAAPINQPTTAKPAVTTPAKAPGSSRMPSPVTKAAPGSPSLIPMTTPDGKSVRMVPENQVQTALGQGYKYKTAGK